MRRVCKHDPATVPDNLIFSPPGICLLILTCLAAVYRHVNRIPEPQLRPVLHSLIPLGVCRLVVGGMNHAALDAAHADFPQRFDGSMLTPIVSNPAALTFTVEFAEGISAADLLMLVSHVQFSAPARARADHVLVAAEARLSPLFGAIGEALDWQQAVIYVPTGSTQLDTVHVLTRSGVFRLALATLRSSAVSALQLPRGLDALVPLPLAQAA